MKINDIVLISILACILFVSEQILSFLPNIQITFLLLIVYSKVIKIKKTLFIIFIHVLLDNLFMASFNIVYVPFMFIGYSIIPLVINITKVESEFKISFLSVLFSIVYTFVYIIPNSILLNINIRDYIIADIPFTIILSISSFVSVFF